MKFAKIFVLICTLVILTSCKSNESGKDLLEQKLNCPYTMSVDFIMSDNDGSVSGRAEIEQNELTTLKIVRPEEYRGITVTSDETGNADTFTFEYSGIPANLPKSISGELSLMFSLFSKTLPVYIAKADIDGFEKTDDGVWIAGFSGGDINFRIAYDCKSGIPSLLEAEHENTSVSVKVLSYKELIKEKQE